MESHRFLPAICAAALALVPVLGLADSGKVLVMPQAELKWVAAGIAGVSTAAARGDMTTGASRFFLKYAAGFVTPPHHHSPDHQVVTISGNLVLSVGGKEYRLAPGSFFSLEDKALHAARCEGSADCVMFVDARGRWDVVPAGK
jgi:anti-sigma factor ChrR (cupin superfamily)